MPLWICTGSIASAPDGRSLPKAATWTEIQTNGMILARYPAPEVWVGRPLPEESLVETAFRQKTGVVEAPDVQGIARLYAFASMPSPLVGSTVVTILSIPTRVLFAQANRVLTRNLLWSGIALGWPLRWAGSAAISLWCARSTPW